MATYRWDHATRWIGGRWRVVATTAAIAGSLALPFGLAPRSTPGQETPASDPPASETTTDAPAAPAESIGPQTGDDRPTGGDEPTGAAGTPASVPYLPTEPFDFPVASEPTAGLDPLAPEQLATVREEFESRSRELRDLFKRLYILQHQFRFALNQDEVREIQNEFAEKQSAGERLLLELQDRAARIYATEPSRDGVMYRFLLSAILDDAEKQRAWTSYRNILLLRKTVGLADAIKPISSLQAFRCGQFQEFIDFLSTADPSTFDDKHREAAMMLEMAVPAWEREKAFRRQDAEAGNLPRVRMTLSTGVVEIELYADQAPMTVANFIELVDAGFYDGLTFHRVLPGFVAQGGCPNGDGMGGPGYFIPCECFEENARGHFLGTLSMANTGQRDTGGSQFFFCYGPLQPLDGKHTAFGRVVSGMEAVERLAPIDPQKLEGTEVPDTIIKAEVIRRREGLPTVRKLNGG